MEQDKQTIKEIIVQTFEEVYALFSLWNPQSELVRINELQPGEEMQISPYMEEVLQLADECYRLSQGLFDASCKPVLDLWKQQLQQGTPPTQQQLQNLHTGWEYIHFGGGKLRKDKEANNTALDLGGIAKGWAVDLLVERLNAAGFSDVYVDWGSDIKATGRHPDNRDWCTTIMVPPSLSSLFQKFKESGQDKGLLTNVLEPVNLYNRFPECCQIDSCIAELLPVEIISKQRSLDISTL